MMVILGVGSNGTLTVQFGQLVSKYVEYWVISQIPNNTAFRCNIESKFLIAKY